MTMGNKLSLSNFEKKKGPIMERLFQDEAVPTSVDEVVADDVAVRISKLFDKYNFISPKDLLTMITLVTTDEVRKRG